MLSRATAGLCSAPSFFPDHFLPGTSNFTLSTLVLNTADTKGTRRNLDLPAPKPAPKTCLLFLFRKAVWFYCQWDIQGICEEPNAWALPDDSQDSRSYFPAAPWSPNPRGLFLQPFCKVLEGETLQSVENNEDALLVKAGKTWPLLKIQKNIPLRDLLKLAMLSCIYQWTDERNIPLSHM